MENNFPSCDNISFGSSSSLLSSQQLNTSKKKESKAATIKNDDDKEDSPQCSNIITSTSSTSTTIELGAFDSDNQFQRVTNQEFPNVGYELSIAKSVLQQYSNLSGDNL